MAISNRILALCAALFLAAAHRLEGQARRVSFDVAAGVTLLNADAAASHRGGEHIHVAARFAPSPQMKTRLRVDASVHTIPAKSSPTETRPDAGLVVLSAGAERSLLRAGPVTAYVAGGAATYNLDQGSGREFHFGLNASGGLRFSLGQFRGLIESRFHQVYTGEPNGFVPIAIGLTF